MNPRLVPPVRLARSVLWTQSDERLTALAGAGSEPAFEVLVARHRRALIRHCARILGPTDADEAVQDALLRAHAALRRGDPVRRVVPWLHVIAHNTALNLLHTRAARAESRPIETCECAASEDRSLEQRLELDELVAAVGSLPSRQRRAIVMRELEGRSYAEIAERLGASQGAVRQLLNRARTTVRERLAVLLPWDSLIRWALSAGNGATGMRVGALSDACLVTVKVCAALVPAAALGVGGLAAIDRAGTSSHLRPTASQRSRRSVRALGVPVAVRAGVGDRAGVSTAVVLRAAAAPSSRLPPSPSPRARPRRRSSRRHRSRPSR
jgi:RNA polymerase sigma factor (sigma-70 family)